MKVSNTALALLFCTITAYSYANTKAAMIVYGEDDRVETYEANSLNQSLANSTAGMIMNEKLIDLGESKSFMLPPISIKSAMGLCENERFSEQPSSVICSGFLVAPDLLVTAGHCVTNQARCEEVSFIFDYKIDKETKRANMIVPKNNVFKCAKVLDAKLEHIPNFLKTGAANSRDFSLIRLDRPVPGRKSLKFRNSGSVSSKTELVVIGHPSGLPQKVTSSAKIFENNARKSYFVTNLDTFGGNSGSAVFDQKTGLIEGILVRGAVDYIADRDNNCLRVNGAEEEITDLSVFGESVSRITDIPTLKNRKTFLAAARLGDITKIKKLLDLGVNINITDDFLNSALHLAVANNKVEAIRFLLAAGIDPDMKNLKGKTAAEISFFNRKARKLVSQAINADN